MGSGKDEHPDLSEPTGRLVAVHGYHLLTGGGGGVMRSAARAFVAVPERRGLSIGIVRADSDRHLHVTNGHREYSGRQVNDFVELPIVTHLPLSGDRGTDALSRNHINVLTSDLIVVLPGGAGTRSELELAVEYGKPLILFVGDRLVGEMTATEYTHRFGSALDVAHDDRELGELMRTLRT